MPTFKDLKIYQEGVRLMLEIDNICKGLPVEERFRLSEKKGYVEPGMCGRLSEDYQGLIKGINGYVNYLKRKRGDGR